MNGATKNVACETLEFFWKKVWNVSNYKRELRFKNLKNLRILEQEQQQEENTKM